MVHENDDVGESFKVEQQQVRCGFSKRAEEIAIRLLALIHAHCLLTSAVMAPGFAICVWLDKLISTMESL